MVTASVRAGAAETVPIHKVRLIVTDGMLKSTRGGDTGHRKTAEGPGFDRK
jgi:hypothetical protein